MGRRSIVAAMNAILVLIALSAYPAAVRARQVFGTGFSVGDGHYILTALHVVTDGKAISISRPDHRGWERVDLVASNPRLDLALLRSATERPALRFADWSEVVAGLDVYVIGYPEPQKLGFSPKITAGIFNGERDVDKKFDLFQISAQIQKGNSGSPVFMVNGLVIGVVVSRMKDVGDRGGGGDSYQGVNFAMKSDVVEKFLKENGVFYANCRECGSSVLSGSLIYKSYSPSIVTISAD